MSNDAPNESPTSPEAPAQDAPAPAAAPPDPSKETPAPPSGPTLPPSDAPAPNTSSSPPMPWGTGPRPEDWVDDLEPKVTASAPVFHTLLTDDGGKVEVAEGEWVDVSAEQLEKVRALSGTGPTAAEALEATKA